MEEVSAEELKKKYEEDLKSLQESCPHEKSHWCIVGDARTFLCSKTDVEVCDNCDKEIGRRSPSICLQEHRKRVKKRLIELGYDLSEIDGGRYVDQN